MTSPLDIAKNLLARGDVANAVATVEAAAESGNASAHMQLAVWRLTGTPLERNLREARRLLRRAVEIGHVDAALAEIALTANGSGGAPDWAGARRLLGEAARNDPVAAQQHALLERMQIDASGLPVALPATEQLSAAPEIRRFRGFLTQDECRHLAQSSSDLLAPGLVSDPTTGRMIAHPIRTSDVAVIGPTREDLVIQAILRRIGAASGTSVGQGEPLNILRYAPGQQYRLHSDALPVVTNQRIKTALLYLNEGFGGGGTVFPELGIEIEPRAGDLVVFSNTLPDGRADPRARHAGLPVTRGAKWLATRWIRAHRYDVWNPG